MHPSWVGDGANPLGRWVSEIEPAQFSGRVLECPGYPHCITNLSDLEGGLPVVHMGRTVAVRPLVGSGIVILRPTVAPMAVWAV